MDIYYRKQGQIGSLSKEFEEKGGNFIINIVGAVTTEGISFNLFFRDGSTQIIDDGIRNKEDAKFISFINFTPPLVRTSEFNVTFSEIIINKEDCSFRGEILFRKEYGCPFESIPVSGQILRDTLEWGEDTAWAEQVMTRGLEVRQDETGHYYITIGENRL